MLGGDGRMFVGDGVGAPGAWWFLGVGFLGDLVAVVGDDLIVVWVAAVLDYVAAGDEDVLDGGG